jgi:hypothetical protein
MITGSVIVGSPEWSMMVCGPFEMLNEILSRPGFSFASRMAFRSEPVPESAVVVTSNGMRIPAVAVPTSIKDPDSDDDRRSLGSI